MPEIVPSAAMVRPAGRPVALKVSVSPASGSEKAWATPMATPAWPSVSAWSGKGPATGASGTGTTVTVTV